jgi:hypothetical protein
MIGVLCGTSLGVNAAPSCLSKDFGVLVEIIADADFTQFCASSGAITGLPAAELADIALRFGAWC